MTPEPETPTFPSRANVLQATPRSEIAGSGRENTEAGWGSCEVPRCGGARPLPGGTDLFGKDRQRVFTPESLVLQQAGEKVVDVRLEPPFNSRML